MSFRVSALSHEPTKGPPGFGLRQSSGAFRPGLEAQKRQRTAAVQDAIATAHPAPRFRVPTRAEKRKETVHGPARPLTPSLSPTGGEGVRRTGEGDLHRFMVPTHAKKRQGALHGLHFQYCRAGILACRLSLGSSLANESLFLFHTI